MTGVDDSAVRDRLTSAAGPVSSAAVTARRTVVAADPTPGGAAAVAWAEHDLISRPRDRMVLLRLNEPIDVPPGPAGLDLFDPAFARQVHRVRDRLGGDRVEASPQTGNTASDILDVLADGDLAVLAAPPFGSARRVATVAARAPGVVVAVRPSDPPPDVTAGIFAGHVIVGVLDGQLDQATIEYAFDFADRHRRPVIVVHADEPMDAGVWADDDDQPRPIDHQFGLDLLDGATAGARERHPDVAVRRALLHVRAQTGLEQASRGAALLVVGDRGRSPLARHVIGSVSRHVLRHAHCSVAVVRQG